MGHIPSISTKFQSALPRRERRRWLQGSRREHRISIRAPAKGATRASFPDFSPSLYFNPRSREGSDAAQSEILRQKNIISIRAPAKGATVQDVIWRGLNTDFNPRSREGSDKIVTENPVESVISIRAPAKGATVSMISEEEFEKISIRAPAKGATLGMPIKEDDSIFQSALPRRERLS